VVIDRGEALLNVALNFLYKYRWPVLLLALVAGIIGGGLASTLTVNDAPERWMPRSAVENWKRFSQHFEYGDTLAFGLHFRDGVKDEDVEYLESMRIALNQVKDVIRVTDVSIAVKWVEGVPLTEMLADPTGDEDPYALYRGLLYDDPRQWRKDELENDPGRTLLMVIETDATVDPALDPLEAQALLDQRRRESIETLYKALDVFHEQHPRPDVTIHPAGGTVIQYELERIAVRLRNTLLPLSVVLTLLAMGLGFRSFAAPTIAVVGSIWAVAVTFGGVAVAGWSLNVVTVGGPVFMMVIIVATTIHIAHYFSDPPTIESLESSNGKAGQGESNTDAAVDGDPPATENVKAQATSRDYHFIRWIAVPCLGAALTTGFGFLMLCFNELGPVRELGIELFFGAVLSFLGAYLTWLIIGRFKPAKGKLFNAGRLKRFGQIAIMRPRTVLICAVLGLLAFGYSTRSLRVDADPFSFFEKNSYVAKSLDHFSSRRFGYYMLDVILVPTDQPTDADARKAAREVDRKFALALEEKLKQRIEVRRVVSEPNVQRRLNHIDQLRIKAQADGNTLETIGYGLRHTVLEKTFKNWLVDLKDDGAIRITFMVYDPGTGFMPLVKAAREQASQLPDERFDYFITGTANTVAILSEQLVGAMKKGLLAAMAAMALLCVVLFRSIRLTLIAFLPNAFPIIMVFGMMGLVGIPLNSGSAMVATIALGIGLNDTVHFVMHYRRWRLEVGDIEKAIVLTMTEIGRPIILTSLVACVGFSIFLLSDFQPMRHFGLLASAAMLAALAGDLVLLPNLLKLFDKKVAGKEEGV
jgi:uncharacterized protein